MNHRRFTQGIVVSLVAYALPAFGGGSSPPPPQSLGRPALSLSLQATKAFRFEWDIVSGITHYKLLEDPTGSSGFAQVGADIAASATSIDHIVPLHRRVNARYILQGCTATGCIDSNTVNVSGSLAQAVGYFKASTIDAADRFGWSVELSADGTTLAVSAPNEASNARGINGNQDNDAAPNSGAVYVFVREGAGALWVQQAYIKASNTGEGDGFGFSLALSPDGSMLAVSALDEDSNATGVNGNQNDNSARDSGAVYVFGRSNGAWSQRAYLKASNTEAYDRFGASLALSNNGTLAVGADFEDSGAQGVGGSQLDNSAGDAGAVYVFVQRVSVVDGVFWRQEAYIKASNTGVQDQFGVSVALSDNGATLAVGARREDGGARGVNGNPFNNFSPDSGAVYVFSRGLQWQQRAYIKASNTGDDDYFGESLALSGDGATLAVGAPGEDSSATGVNGDQNNNAMSAAGAAYVFVSVSGIWAQQAYIKASNTDQLDKFGVTLALSSNGSALAVAASWEDSGAIGIDGDQNDNSTLDAGAVYVFGRSNGAWAQQAYVKPSNTRAAARVGTSVSLSGDGATLAAGAHREDGGEPGVNPNQNSEPIAATGAVYVY